MAADPLSQVAAGVGIAQGVAGLFGGKGSKRRQRSAEDIEREIRDMQAGGLRDAIALARGYDPVREQQSANRLATERASQAFGREAERLNARYAARGGSAAGDTQFRVDLDQRAAALSDPLRAALAETRASATARRLSALTQALGMGGDVAAGYGRISEANRSDPTGSLQLLAGGLDRVLGGRRKKGGTSLGDAKNVAQFWTGFGLGGR